MGAIQLPKAVPYRSLAHNQSPLGLSVSFYSVSGVFEVRGDEMWCSVCHVMVQHKSLPEGMSGLYRSAERVGEVHLGALRKAISGKPVWVGTDEWTDSQGHAIINVAIGCAGDVYVVATIQLDCKGPNLGVQHSNWVHRHPDKVECFPERWYCLCLLLLPLPDRPQGSRSVG